MKPGIGTYTFTWAMGVSGYDKPSYPMDAAALIKIAAKSGMRIVQLMDNYPLKVLEKSELISIAKMAADNNIEIEIGLRGNAPSDMLAYLDIARTLNSKLLRILITDEALSEAEVKIQAVIPEFERTGVTLAVENHGLHGVRELAALIEKIESSAFGCCLDTVNSFQRMEDFDCVVKYLAPSIKSLHIKDFVIKRHRHMMGFEVIGCPAGEGMLRTEELLSILNTEANRNISAILELWTPYQDNVDITVALEKEFYDKSVVYLKKRKELDFI